jgi:hypothetical protein
MAYEIRDGDAKVRVVRLLRHHNDAGGMNNREFIDGIIKAQAEAALKGGAHKF